MKRIRWSLMGILGGVASIIIGFIAVLRAGGQIKFWSVKEDHNLL